MEFDYIIFNSFDSTIMALLKVALIYSHNDYTTLIFLAAVAGLGFGAMVSLGRAATSGKSNLLTFTIPAILGIIIYIAMIQPRGTLHVYDSGTNQYQALDLPVIIVFIAGVTNYVETAVIDIIDDSASYVTANSNYRTDSGGLSFNMITDAVKVAQGSRSRYFRKSVQTYVDNCIAPAYLFDGAPNIDGLDESDILTYFDGFTAIYNVNTTWYDDANRGGTQVTCGEAVTNMQNEFLDTAPHDRIIEEVCLKAGFNVGTAALLNQCRNKIASKAEVGSPSLDMLLQDVLLSDAVMEAVSANDNIQGTLTTLANRNMQVSNIGAAEVANEWIPVIRSVVVAITFGLTPLVGLFIVTPLFFRVLLFVSGMLIWLSTWSVVDALIHAYSVDMALKVFDGMVEGTIGMKEIIYMPDAMQKATGVFGKSRTIAVTISTVIMYSIFRFGGMALAGAAGRFTENAQNAGEQAGMAAATPEGRASLINGQIAGSTADAMLDKYGAEGMKTAAMYNSAVPVSTALQTMQKATMETGPSAAFRTADRVANGRSYENTGTIGKGTGERYLDERTGTSKQQRSVTETISDGSDRYGSSKANMSLEQETNMPMHERAQSNREASLSKTSAQTDKDRTEANKFHEGSLYQMSYGAAQTAQVLSGSEAISKMQENGQALRDNAGNVMDQNSNYLVAETKDENGVAMFSAQHMESASHDSKVSRTDQSNFGVSASTLVNAFGPQGSQQAQDNALKTILAGGHAAEIATGKDLTAASEVYQKDLLGEQDSERGSAGVSGSAAGNFNIGKGFLPGASGRASLQGQAGYDWSQQSTDSSNVSATGVTITGGVQTIMSDLRKDLGNAESQEDINASYESARERMGHLVNESVQGRIDSNIEEARVENKGINIDPVSEGESSGGFDSFKENSQNIIQGVAGKLIEGDVEGAFNEFKEASKENIQELIQGGPFQNAVQTLSSKEEILDSLTEVVIDNIPDFIRTPIETFMGEEGMRGHIKEQIRNGINDETQDEKNPVTPISRELFNRKPDAE